MIEEMSDASGTLWLDVGARDWSGAALSAYGLTRAAMPSLVAGIRGQACCALARDTTTCVGWRRGGQCCGRHRPSLRFVPATLSFRLVLPACCLPSQIVRGSAATTGKTGEQDGGMRPLPQH
jgi:hypothetical protein